LAKPMIAHAIEFRFVAGAREAEPMPDKAFANSAIGCWDYHPLATALKFPMHMVWQNAQNIIAGALGLIDEKNTDPQMIEIKTALLRPRQMHHSAFGDQG